MPPFLEFSQRRKLTLQNHVFFLKKNFKIHISTKRCNKWVLWSFKYEVEYMVWHSQWIYRGFLRDYCFCCCEYIFKKINWHILSVFFPLVFAIYLGIVKTDVKNVLWRVFFSRTGPAILCLFGFVPFACYGFVFKTTLSILFWVLDWSVLCLEVTCWCICNNFKFLQIDPVRRDFISSQQTLELVQTKNCMSSHSSRFSSGVLNLSCKVQSKLLWLKNYQESVKIRKINDSNL